MKKLINTLTKKIGTATLALSNVEKNALNQTGELMSTDTHKFQKHTQGQVADSLINGEVTQEVMDLRWRMYKVLRATEGLTAKITGYEADGTPIVTTYQKNSSLRKIKIDTTDNYPLEMVVDNGEIYLSGNESMETDYLKIYDSPITTYDNDNNASLTVGEINGLEYFTSQKTDRPIKVTRDNPVKFNLENFATKLNIRTINENKKLLEFYISIYPNPDDRKTHLLISDIKKAIDNPKQSPMLEIKSVNFVTYKTLGIPDYLLYEYDIESFDKITIFNGYYLIKFIGNVKTNGKDIFETHRMNELDKKYENKLKK